MKITIFIFLSILFSLNQVKNLSIGNHDLTVNKKSVDKYYEVYNGIEKKNRRQYFQILNFFIYIKHISIYLACMWRICSWPSRKEKEKEEKRKLQILRKKFQVFKAPLKKY